MKRTIIVLGVTTLMAALIAGPVAARAVTTRYVVEGAYPDPETGNTATLYIMCGDYAGEYALSYHYKAFVTTVTKPSGEEMITIHSVNLQGQAVNAETGRTFYFTGTNNETHQVGFNQYAGTQLLVTRGGEFDFLFSYSVRTDANGEPVFEHVQARDNCAG